MSKFFQIDQLMAIGAVLILPSLAQAHAHLHSSEPNKDVVLNLAPHEIVLHFTEALEAPLCKIELKNAQSGEMISLPKASAVIGDAKSLQIPLSEKKIKDGSYKVLWKVVSKDGHKMQGDYPFYLKSKTGKK